MMDYHEGQAYIPSSTFIRSLNANVTFRLTAYLNVQNNWKTLVPFLTMPDGREKYGSVQIDQLTMISQCPGGDASKDLLYDWGTTNATVDKLLEALIQARLYTVADYISEKVLGYGRANRLPQDQDARANQLPQDQDMPHIAHIPTVQPAPRAPNESEEHFSFQYLAHITDNFNDVPMMAGGNLIGQGGFGKVFLGRDCQKASLFAVKKLNEAINSNSHETEALMCRMDHVNLLKVEGYCTESNLCIIYPYMENGSLEDRMARKGNTQIILMDVRLSIIKGIAAGIYHLHTNKIIHRDIKSANILLDENLVPKVGDFGIITVLPTDTVTTMMATSMFGTGPYMAPEAMLCKVTPKVDVFAYGVLLLELLTSLKAYDESREDPNLADFVENEEEEFRYDLVDKNCGDWPEEIVNTIVDLSKCCRSYKYKKRPTMECVLKEIEEVITGF